MSTILKFSLSYLNKPKPILGTKTITPPLWLLFFSKVKNPFNKKSPYMYFFHILQTNNAKILSYLLKYCNVNREEYYWDRVQGLKIVMWSVAQINSYMTIGVYMKCNIYSLTRYFACFKILPWATKQDNWTKNQGQNLLQMT